MVSTTATWRELLLGRKAKDRCKCGLGRRGRSLRMEPLERRELLSVTPIGYWELDETGGTTASDISGNNLIGTLLAGAQWTPDGKLGGAVDLDGSGQYVQVADSDLLDNTSELTISAWVYARTLDGSARGIVSKRVSMSSNLSYSLFFHTGNRLHVYIDGANDTFSSNTVFQTDRWYHVAVTFDGSLPEAERVKLYVDGKLDKVASETSSSIPNYASNLTLGILNAGYHASLDGKIDDVRIYDQALGADDIAQQARLPVAHWELDETAGSSASDAAGNNHAGTLMGGAQWTPDGKLGGAIDLDGDNQYVHVADANALDNTSQLTVSTWVYARTLDGQARGIVSKRVGANNQHAYSLYFHTGNKLHVQIVGSNDVFSSNTVFQTGRWYHIAVTFDGSLPEAERVKLYVDGKLDKVASETSSFIPNYASNLTLGILNAGYHASLDGKIDDARIYSQALSAEEIAQQARLPVAHWKLDETGGTSASDAAGNALTGTLMGGAQWTPDGKLGGAIDLDGDNQYVHVADANALDNTSQLTISTWVYARTLDGQARGIVSKRNGMNSQHAYSLFFYTGNKLHVYIDGANDTFSSNTVFQTGRWYHVAVTFDGSLPEAERVKLYVDGVLDTVASETSSFIPNYSSPLTLGTLNANYQASLDGKIDDARIYNQALSAEEIAQQARLPVAHWKLDEAGGTSASDAAGNALTGTLMNGAQWTADGKLGGAIDLDGDNQYVHVADANALDNTSQLTISTWVYARTLDGQARGIVSKRNGMNKQHAYSLYFHTGNKLHVYIDGVNDVFSSNTVFAMHRWYHVAVTFDGSLPEGERVKLYVDGKLDTVSSETSSVIPNYASPLTLGTLNANYHASLDGKIDDVRIYNQALSAEAIRSLHAADTLSTLALLAHRLDALSGDAIHLNAVAVDPLGVCESVAFYLDSNGNGILDPGDQLLATDASPDGGWSATVSTEGWALGTHTLFAQGTFDGVATNVVASTLWLNGAMAFVGPGGPGYAESGAGWGTVIDANAYAGSYRQTSTAGDYATYTFTGLAPGNYEFWVQYAGGSQHPGSVSLRVYDGDAETGRLQHTFAVNERTPLSTSAWGVRNYDGYNWGWLYTGVAEGTVGTVYSNTGTITVRLPYAGANTQAPTLWLMAAPAGFAPYIPGALGGRETSRDSIEYAAGGISECFCDTSLSSLAAPVYSNANALAISLFGFGQMAGQALLGMGMYITAINWDCIVCDSSSTFLDPQRFYVPLYGTQDTLVDGANHLTLTKPNGAVVQFVRPVEDGVTYATGPWQATIRANGHTRRVVSWLGNPIDGRPLEVQESLSPAGQPYASELYSYVASGPNAGLVESITYRHWDDDANDWVNVYRAEYTYYVTGEGADAGDNYHGLSGDLKTVTTRYWDGGQWAGADTYYYRYYTGTTYDGQQNVIGFAHGLRRLVLPNAYNKLSEYAAGLGKTPDELLDSEVAAYTCFYYEYDAFRRVTSQTVFGGLRTTTFAYTEGSNAVLNGDGTANLDVWTRKTVETRPDGSTYTVYTNYVGQTLLSDLADPSGVRTYAYYEYDADGRPILAASTSAIDAYDDGAGGDFRISLTVTGAGPVEQYTYYATTTATAETPGGAAGYLATVALAEGLVAPTGGATSYWNTEMVLQGSYDYFKHTGSNPGGSQATVYPVASVTRYADEAGTAPVTTSYAYTWHEGSVQRATVVTTLPAVAVGQHGDGQAAQRVAFYDEAGNLTWSKDERGFLTRYLYDPLTGRMIQSIDDADTAGVANLPVDPTTGNPLATPAGGGQNLVSDYAYDALGRITQALGPAHLVDGVSTRSAMWVVYDDAAGETRSAAGYAMESTPGSGTFDSFTIVGPVGVTRRDADGRVLEQIEATPEVTTTGDPLASLAAETFSLDEVIAWTAYQYRRTQLVAMAFYHTIPDVASDPDADGFTGARGTHYDVYAYGYDSVGRNARVVSPGGTVSQAFFDARGLVLETWIGTDDVPDADHNGDGTIDFRDFRWYVENHGAAPAGTDMVLVSQYEYDGGQAGDGLLTKVTEHADDCTTRTVEFGYDWRNRHVWSYRHDGTYGTYSFLTYDNLGRVTTSEEYWDADEDFSSQGPEPAAGDVLIARSEAAYDDRGRVYAMTEYGVDPSDGSVGDALTNRFWYDAAGNVIKSQSAGTEQFTKIAYDGLGRVVAQYVGFDASETTYAEAGNVDGDTIFTQVEYAYNAAGSLIFVTMRDRLHDATGTGALNGPAGSQPRSRDSYVAYWYDGVGRQTAVANYGTAGGTVMDVGDRPDAAPARSDTVLVTSYEYDPAGRLYKVIDPAGRDDRTFYDALGRVVRTIANYTDGDPATGGTDQDVTVETTYTPDGRIATYTAVNPATGDQVTRYVYGTTLADSGVARSDLLRAVIYPDSDDTLSLSDGADDIYDRVEYRYNRLGHVIWTKDQNETVHEYAFDGLGRQTADMVTLPQGSAIDDSVLRIEHGYEVRGMVASITSFDARTGGNAVNQVLREYNDFGLLTTEYQEHTGEVDANTLYVQYNYADASAGLRLESVRYPNGRLVHYTYGSAGSDADRLNRLDAIRDDDGGNPGDVLAQYTYLGLGTVVVEDYVQPQVKLDLWGGTSGEYQGFDRFGRVVDHLWRDYGASADADRFLYGYDRAGNRIWKENDVSANLGTPVHLDELYEYDELYRLINTQRGNLSANRDAITDKAFEQDWGLDATGNWSAFNEDLDGGGWDLEQTREHNAANEVTSAGGWATPAHDRVGNMTTLPKPGSPADALDAKYDAWNRLFEVSEGGVLIAKFSYDGAGRRILKQLADAQEPDQFIHFYHSGGQVVEIRAGDDSAGVPQPEQLPPRHQFVWSPRYIDALILRDEYNAQGQLDDGARLFYLADANFNVTVIVGLVETEPDVFEWQVLERYVYSPYGAATIYTPDWSTVLAESAHGNTTLYTGREFDAETGLYYYLARYYHAELGRFISRDPIGYEAGDVNLYRYVGNRPVIFVDPEGHEVMMPGPDAWNDNYGPPSAYQPSWPRPYPEEELFSLPLPFAFERLPWLNDGRWEIPTWPDDGYWPTTPPVSQDFRLGDNARCLIERRWYLPLEPHNQWLDEPRVRIPLELFRGPSQPSEPADPRCQPTPPWYPRGDPGMQPIPGGPIPIPGLPPGWRGSFGPEIRGEHYYPWNWGQIPRQPWSGGIQWEGRY